MSERHWLYGDREAAAALWVPVASLPGLDPRGLTILALWDYADPRSKVDLHDICVRVDGDLVVVWEAGGETLVPAAAALVDMADAATRDRVARWCAARLGWPAQTSAPTWMRTLDFGAPEDDSTGWCLVDSDDRTAVFLARGKVQLPNERRLPGLAALDKADARTLPDGTSYVDAAALAVAARHLGAR